MRNEEPSEPADRDIGAVCGGRNTVYMTAWTTRGKVLCRGTPCLNFKRYQRYLANIRHQLGEQIGRERRNQGHLCVALDEMRPAIELVISDHQTACVLPSSRRRSKFRILGIAIGRFLLNHHL